MIIFDNPVEYLDAAGADIKARITRLTTIIVNLENMIANIGSTGSFQSYQFNDGQSQINTTYRTLTEVTNAINAFETIRTRLINKCEGRTTILRDSDTLVRRLW